MCDRTRMQTHAALGAAAALLALALSGCSNPRPAETPAETTPAAVTPAGPPAFVNVVWRVSRSSSVQTGMLYAFLDDSTLVLTSNTSRPSFGTWRYADGALTMVEEGRSYPVDVVSLTEDSLSIVIRGPGLPVEMTLVPAQQPLTR